jgi:hypothetical protein
MAGPPRAKLTLAELLIVLAFVGIGLGLARRGWHDWQAEERTLAAGWMGAWLVGVVGGRAFQGKSLLPACLLCALTAAAVSVYFQFSWEITFILVVATLAATLATAGLPWLIGRGLQWQVRLATGQVKVPRHMLASLGGASVLAISGTAATLWLRDPPVTTTVIRRFEHPRVSPGSARQRGPSLHGVSSGGRYLILWTPDGVVLFDARSADSRLVPNTADLQPAAVSADGRFLGGWRRDRGEPGLATALCMDTRGGQVLLSLPVAFPLATISFPDAATIALSTGNSAATRLEFHRWLLHSRTKQAARWEFECPDGARLAAVSPGGEFGIVDYARISAARSAAADRWEIWKLSPPAKKIADGQDTPFHWDRSLGGYGWFAIDYRFGDANVTPFADVWGTALGLDFAGAHLPALRYDPWVPPSFPMVGLTDDLREQVPFWRLYGEGAGTVALWLYDRDRQSPICKSRPATVVGRSFEGRPVVFNTHAAADGAAFALQDETGKIILWRIRRSPFAVGRRQAGSASADPPGQ